MTTTDTPATSTAWIRVGAQVAEYDGSGYDPRVALTTIAKLTKTQIVLANEHRYNLATQKGIGSNGNELLPADHPRVRRAQDGAAYRTMTLEIDRIERDLNYQRTDIYQALDAIERAVREARAAIGNTTAAAQ